MKRVAMGMAMVLVLASGALAGGALVVEKEPAAPPEDVVKVAEGVNRFAFDLYAQLRGAEGNLFLSPYSISTALTMTYAGARGQTAEQMDKVLQLPGETQREIEEVRLDEETKFQHVEYRVPWLPERLHSAYGALQKDLNAAGEGGAFELVVANRLWGQKGFAFLPDFLAILEASYGAGLEQLDFARETEEARKTINAWVEKQTRDKIKDLLKPGVLDAATRLVLTNAIYFKGKWAEEFDKKATQDEEFFLTPETKVAAPLMHQTKHFGYLEGDDLQVLELAYQGDRLSMVVLLPKAKDGLAALEEALSADKVAEWIGKLHRREVRVALPRFKTTAEFSLAEVLAAMGMKDAFDAAKADFSGMDGKKDLFISAVVHKAFVDTNEEGTEAAAATAVIVPLAAMPEPTPVFRADHPFLFLIRDSGTGAILFLGRIADPTK